MMPSDDFDLEAYYASSPSTDDGDSLGTDSSDEGVSFESNSYWSPGDGSTVGPWTTESNLILPVVRQLGHQGIPIRNDTETPSNGVMAGADNSSYNLSIDGASEGEEFETINLQSAEKPVSPAISTTDTSKSVTKLSQEQAPIKSGGRLRIVGLIIFMFFIFLVTFLAAFFYMIWRP